MKIRFEISIEELDEIIKREYDLDQVYFNSAKPIFGKKVILIEGDKKIRNIKSKGTGGKK